jgi:hypothetical protein
MNRTRAVQMLVLTLIFPAGCARADIGARDGTLLGFMVVLLIASTLAPLVFSFVVVPLFGLAAITMRGTRPSLFTYPVLALLVAVQAYFWGGWAAYCSWLAGGYAASPRAWAGWIYYLLAFFGCTGPIGYLTATEQRAAQSEGEVTNIAAGSFRYSVIVVVAYVVFSIWPGIAVPLYGWLLK